MKQVETRALTVGVDVVFEGDRADLPYERRFVDTLPEIGSQDDPNARALKLTRGIERQERQDGEVVHYGGGVHYGDTSLTLRKGAVRISSKAEAVHLAGTGDLIEYLPWLLDVQSSKAGWAFAHAAAVSRDGRATLISGWGGAGKTSSLRSFISAGYQFLSDDLVHVASDGAVSGVPKPMYIYPYHRAVYPHLFEDKQKVLVPSRLSHSMERVRQWGRPLVEPYPKLKQFAQKWTPEHMQVSPAKVFPNHEFATRSQLDDIIYLERGMVSSVRVSDLDTKRLVDRMNETLLSEFTANCRQAMHLAGGTGIISLEGWLSRRRDVIAAAVAGARTVGVTIPMDMPARDVGPHVLTAIAGTVET